MHVSLTTRRQPVDSIQIIRFPTFLHYHQLHKTIELAGNEFAKTLQIAKALVDHAETEHLQNQLPLHYSLVEMKELVNSAEPLSEELESLEERYIIFEALSRLFGERSIRIEVCIGNMQQTLIPMLEWIDIVIIDSRLMTLKTIVRKIEQLLPCRVD